MHYLSELYELQQIELDIDMLRKRLKEHSVFDEFKKLQNEAADSKKAVELAEGKLNEQRIISKRLEMDMQKVEAQNKAVQASLYDGSVNNAKELSQLEEKGKELSRERDKQEEAVLLSMEVVEELELSFETAKKKYKNKVLKLKELQNYGNKEIQHLKDEIMSHQEKRDTLSQKISKELLEDYKSKRRMFSGRPLALLIGDICGVCRVSISSRTKNLLCNPEAVVVCDNCGRILIPKPSF